VRCRAARPAAAGSEALEASSPWQWSVTRARAPARAPDRAAPEHCAQVGDLRALTGDLAGSVAAYLEALREAGGLWGERDGERVAGKLAGALGGSAAHVTGL